MILSCNGQRTMRTCLDGAAALTAKDLSAADFAGAAWAFFSAYGLYQPGLLPRAMALARQASCRRTAWAGQKRPPVSWPRCMSVAHTKGDGATLALLSSAAAECSRCFRLITFLSEGPHTCESRWQAGARVTADFAWFSAVSSAVNSSAESRLSLQHDHRGQAGAKVALDLASFEVVRAFRDPLLELLAAHRPDFLICNEVRRRRGLTLHRCCALQPRLSHWRGEHSSFTVSVGRHPSVMRALTAESHAAARPPALMFIASPS